MKTWDDYGIEIPSNARGDVKTKCPQCHAGRKNKGDRSLSVNVEKEVWLCHHCDWRGTLKQGQTHKSEPNWWREFEKPREYRRPERTERPVTEAANEARQRWAAYMRGRGIPASVMKDNGIDVRWVWMPQTQTETWALAYPYEREGELIDVKYRSMDKHFRTEKDAEKILYRIDRVADPDIDTVIVTEGENDCLALQAAGFQNAVSVPVGASDLNKEGRIPNLDGKLACLEDPYTAKILEQKTTFILAMDGDRPGRILAEEVARRLGVGRCRMVHWPEDCKDANEVLVAHGVETLRELIVSAPLFPIDGIISVRDFRDVLDDVYEYGMPPGPSTGWVSIDEIYRPGLGLTTIVTGVPTSGKSRWVNALLVNMAKHHDARFALCSPEYRPTHLLASHLTETYIGKTMLPGHPQRMTREEYEAGSAFIDEHLHFIVPKTTSVDEILERARLLVARYGIRGLVIDPWTEVEYVKSWGQNDVDALKEQLGKVQQFGAEYQTHNWIVAHPKNLHVPEGETAPRVPGLSDIAGGAQWGNKADFVVSLWRDKSTGTNEVEIHMQKVRFQHLGHDGQKRILYFDRLTGRFSDGKTETTTGWSSIV